MDGLSPRFPPELERLIFTYAAYLSPRKLGGFLLVARRVHHWIEPLRYRDLELTRSTSREFLQLLSQKSPEFLSAHVSVLMLHHYTPSDTSEPAWFRRVDGILKNCVGIIDLTFSGVSYPYIDWASFAHLRVLNLDRSACISFRDMLRGAPGLTLPHITHLEYHPYDTYHHLLGSQMVASQLPGLTHLLLSRWKEQSLPQVRDLLLLNQIQRLVILGVDKELSLLENEKLVLLPPNDMTLKERWKLRTSGHEGYDYWVLAENIVRSRDKV
ncbi:hypothetical protein DL96DRAFT_1621455 [Flagelloscypha sp. PMI_526]|nr:hypothetical protein DL96DRAFT_1621455 [Flagelloscypha sp. PMI_526]